MNANSMRSATIADVAVFPATVPAIFCATDRRIAAAVAISLLIHGMALSWLPGPKKPMIAVQQRLQVRLLVPVAQSEPAASPPAPTSGTSRRSPAPAFAPTPSAIRGEGDVPTQENKPMLTSSPTQTLQEKPAILASGPARPTGDEPVRPSQARGAASSDRFDAGALTAYGLKLAGEFAAHQRYPRVALLRQWQGTAVLQLELSADGGLLSVRVLNSSGHESLDRRAVEMVREAVPLSPPPIVLAGRPLTVDVPVVFRITS
jgi:protein TonB